MKMLDIYNSFGVKNEQDGFEFLINNLKSTIKTYDFYVHWDKIHKNIDEIEIALNTMNFLIGKENIEQEVEKLIKIQPNIVQTIPILLACRDNSFKILDENNNMLDYNFNFKTYYSNEEIEDIVLFLRKTGILFLLENQKIKNLVDYCFGVEVGLDTNARKNRSGTIMENIVEN